MEDVIIVGAGAAGLMAARELRNAGKRVLILESSNRVGGRARTIHDPAAGIPIELGAEFIHGEAKETYKLLEAARLATVPVLGEHYRSDGGKFDEQEKIWKRMSHVLKRMKDDRDEDRSFQEFLDTNPGGPLYKEERELAKGFVEGFNGADARLISEKALAEQGDPTEAAAKASRVVQGYGALIDYIANGMDDVVRKNCVVQRILWDQGKVTVFAKSSEQFNAKACVITVPLPHLQNESIAIEPEVLAAREAAGLLMMGHVAKVNVVLKERFWSKAHAELSYLHTPRRAFNVFWTMYPIEAPVIVAWSGGPVARKIEDHEEVTIKEMARAFGMKRARMESLIETMHSCDWSSDAHTLGAYSYVGVDGSGANDRLSRPVRGTLFFAGEATDAENAGTVEAALASGKRAARQVLQQAFR